MKFAYLELDVCSVQITCEFCKCRCTVSYPNCIFCDIVVAWSGAGRRHVLPVEHVEHQVAKETAKD
jgi:hypothetical protein